MKRDLAELRRERDKNKTKRKNKQNKKTIPEVIAKLEGTQGDRKA